MSIRFWKTAAWTGVKRSGTPKDRSRVPACCLHAQCRAIGGQAVMDGVMMRNGPHYGLAVRLANGKICAERLEWVTLMDRPWLRLPFIRGFPILIETMVNGIHAFNRSVALYEQRATYRSSPWQLAWSLALAIILAMGLFVIAPHLLSLGMHLLGIGGDLEGMSFHIWDGFFKCAIFITYVWLISFLPDIRKVFEYHGAEHKTVRAWETEQLVSARAAMHMSRLHPRCGTTFLLFVICLSIFLQALLVPLLFAIWTPASALVKHGVTIIFKLLLVVPISAAAYELIRFGSSMPEGLLSDILLWPGLMLQRLTTREPSGEQLEVAVIALFTALGPEATEDIQTADYELRQ